MVKPVLYPDLSKRPLSLRLERKLNLDASRLFWAWTEGFGMWFADPQSVLMKAEVNGVFYFETVHKFENNEAAKRHPHYGRFLTLEKDRKIEMTWITGNGGTEGAETVLTIELHPEGDKTRLVLQHAGFGAVRALKNHEQAWPYVLDQIEEKLKVVHH